jgi:PPM family protein phosphatase
MNEPSSATRKSQSMAEQVPAPTPPISTQVRTYCHAFALSHVGHVRQKNEDQYVIANLTNAMQVVSTSSGEARVYFGADSATLFVVADGMGGHAGGQQASALALSAVEAFILRTLGHMTPFVFHEIGDLLRSCFQNADATVFDSAQHDPTLHGMGTTMTVGLLIGKELHLAHAGDSRAYLLRNGLLYRLTRDHTIAGELEGQGIINAQEAEEHPMRHMVTNFVGGGHRGVAPDLAKIPLGVGDKLLFATDGLTDLVSDDILRDVLIAEMSAETGAGRLVDAALTRGGTDNVTALVVTFDATPERNQ